MTTKANPSHMRLKAKGHAPRRAKSHVIWVLFLSLALLFPPSLSYAGWGSSNAQGNSGQDRSQGQQRTQRDNQDQRDNQNRGGSSPGTEDRALQTRQTETHGGVASITGYSIEDSTVTLDYNIDRMMNFGTAPNQYSLPILGSGTLRTSCNGGVNDRGGWGGVSVSPNTAKCWEEASTTRQSPDNPYATERVILPERPLVADFSVNPSACARSMGSGAKRYCTDGAIGLTGETGDDMFKINANGRGFLEYPDGERVVYLNRTGGPDQALMIPAGPRSTRADYHTFVDNIDSSILSVTDACLPAEFSMCDFTTIGNSVTTEIIPECGNRIREQAYNDILGADPDGEACDDGSANCDENCNYLITRSCTGIDANGVYYDTDASYRVRATDYTRRARQYEVHGSWSNADPGTAAIYRATDNPVEECDYYCKSGFTWDPNANNGNGSCVQLIEPECEADVHRQNLDAAPASNRLCEPNKGTAENYSYDPATLTYTWTCNTPHNLNGPVNCIASQKVNGECNATTNGSQTRTEPSRQNKCAVGEPINESFRNNTWTWQCSGTNGGTDSTQCSATIPNPECGDGFVEGREACDDGNTTWNGTTDICVYPSHGNACQIWERKTCTGLPSQNASYHGDGAYWRNIPFAGAATRYVLGATVLNTDPGTRASYAENDTPSEACDFKCNDGFSWNGNACVKAPEPVQADCRGVCGNTPMTCNEDALGIRNADWSRVTTINSSETTWDCKVTIGTKAQDCRQGENGTFGTQHCERSYTCNCEAPLGPAAQPTCPEQEPFTCKRSNEKISNKVETEDFYTWTCGASQSYESTPGQGKVAGYTYRYDCYTPKVANPTAFCGNGVREETEACDKGVSHNNFTDDYSPPMHPSNYGTELCTQTCQKLDMDYETNNGINSYFVKIQDAHNGPIRTRNVGTCAADKICR